MRKSLLLITYLLIGIATMQSQTPPIIYVSGDGSGDYNCDGISDQIEINQALDFVAANSNYTTVYLKGQNTYWIDEPIFISENTTLEGDSNAVVKLIDSADWNTQYKPLIGQTGLTYTLGLGDPSTTTGNITIRGFEIDGNRQNQSEPSGNSYYSAIVLQNCYNITINDMYIHDCLADALQTGYDLYGFDINLQFYNNHIHASGHDGIIVINCKNFEIHDNIFTDNRTDAHIRVQYCNQFKIYNNIGGNDPNRQYSGGIGISMQADASTPLNDAEVYNNYFYGKGAFYGIWLWQTSGGGTLNTHENVHIHHNIISWYKKGAIGIEGFHNTLIENNVIQSDGGLENTYPAPGIVFLGGDPTNNISGFQTTVKNNIIIDNVTYGIDNQAPAIHSFVSEYNCINGNVLGNYNNVTSTTDIYNYPELASNLSDIYYNILDPNWQNAVSSGNFEGDLGANEAKLEYHLKSENGRWNGSQWIMDTITSPCIDAGDTTYDYSNEPTPNGSRINLGAFGNTTFTSKSSNPLSINEYSNTNINIYPNPTSDKIIIPNEFVTNEYSIYSLTGELIKSGKLNTNEIQIAELNAGIYILKIRDNKSDKMNVFKMIKE
ncbi:MAG: hypothetical protein COB12_07765 [Flavobacterium sp.]|nr:MAG: hypothetical protein COB12_07765 [Flavobacterium sp.]